MFLFSSFTYVRTIPKHIFPVSHVCISDTLSDVVTVHQIIATRSLHTISNIPKTNSVKEESRKHEPAQEKGFTEEKEKIPGTSEIERKRPQSVKHKSSTLVKPKSKIRVHTINGDFIGEVNTLEKVTCLCYSNAPEGVSVNSILVGLHTGAIRLFSSWDLKPVAHLVPFNYSHPLLR